VDKLEKCRAELEEVNDRLCCEIAERALLEEEVSGLRGKNREVMAELASFEAMNRHK
jgi:predicted nuclease with TOPRIM domain